MCYNIINMKKHFWKIEYSYTLIVIFTVILFMIPTSFSSKEAGHISHWNEVYNKLDYLFTAMSAQAESDIVKGLKNAQTLEQREFYMMQLVKAYLELTELNKSQKKRYSQQYMNGNKVNKKDIYHFDNIYVHKSGAIVGIKDINNKDELSPGFMMFVDLNGVKSPNIWGRDIFGIDIYSDGKIKPMGHEKQVTELKKDCSVHGLGVSCSHYYRIGGEFVE